MSESPDMIDFQKMVLHNLMKHYSRPENTEHPINHSEALDIGMGFSVSAMLKSENNDTPPPRAIREHLIYAYNNGTASDFGHFMQLAIPAATEVVQKFSEDRKHANRDMHEGMGYHLLWYIPCAFVILLLTAIPNLLCVSDYIVTFFKRFHWAVFLSPSALVFINAAWFSVVAPSLALFLFPKIYSKTPKRKFWMPMAFFAGILLISIISEIAMWGSFPLPVDKDNYIHIRMIPFIPWPEEGRSNIFF